MKTKFLSCIILVLLSTEILSQNAPVTTAGRVTDAMPGDPAVPVPVSVSGFLNIGQFTLTMKFDTTKVKFVSGTCNPALTGMTLTYFTPSGNNTARLIMSWTGSGNQSLDDGSLLANLVFHYVGGTGILSWAYTFGSVCSYKRYAGSNLVAVSDSPKYQYYRNGGISNRSAPSVFAPFVENPQPGPANLEITTEGFDNIASLNLYLEYDPAVITYLNSFIRNPAFDSNFQVGDIAGTGGKRLLILQWYGGALSLPDGAILCTFHFNYPSATCTGSSLAWYDTGPTCEFLDGGSNILIDMPSSSYYHNGMIHEGLPATWTGNNSSNWDDPGNWTSCGLPGPARNVVIPNVSPHPYPVIAGWVVCGAVNLENGAVITIAPGGNLIIE